MRAVRAADREDSRRRPWHLVLPGLPTPERYHSQQVDIDVWNQIHTAIGPPVEDNWGQVVGRGASPALAMRAWRNTDCALFRQTLLCSQALELAAAIELPELGVAADRPAVDDDLRNRPPAGQLEQSLPEDGIVVE
jgi:hypothetical protein